MITAFHWAATVVVAVELSAQATTMVLLDLPVRVLVETQRLHPVGLTVPRETLSRTREAVAVLMTAGMPVGTVETVEAELSLSDGSRRGPICRDSKTKVGGIAPSVG